MTLCIAAECQTHDLRFLIAASDFSSETPTARGEIQDKLVVFEDKYVFLVAGTLSRAMELLNTFHHEFKKSPPKHDTLVDDVSNVITKQKRKFADQYVGAALGMTYAEFLKRGPRLPPKVFSDTLLAVQGLGLECSLILAVFMNGAPHLLRIHEDGLIEPCMHFCAIGSGLTIAEAAMFQRAHHVDVAPSLGVYHVYEAMRLGSNAPGVGNKFALSILAQVDEGELSWHRLDLPGVEYLEKQFKKYGPREIKEMKIEDGFLKRFGEPMEYEQEQPRRKLKARQSTPQKLMDQQ